MSFVLKNSYKFSMKNEANGILGNTYSNMQCIGVGSYDVFLTASSDILTTHTTLQGMIPNLPRAADCTFYLFKDSFGNKKVFALEYILQSSIVATQTINIIITVPNVDSDAPSIITTELGRLGYKNINIEIA